MVNEYPTKAIAKKFRRKGEVTVKRVRRFRSGRDVPKHLRGRKVTYWVNKKRR